MTESQHKTSHGLKATVKEYLTHWTIAGGVVALTGFAPDHWVGHLLHAIPGGMRHAFPEGIDYRLAVVGFGVAMIVADILVRNRQRAKLLLPAAALDGQLEAKTAERADATVRPTAAGAAMVPAGPVLATRGALASHRANRRSRVAADATDPQTAPSVVPAERVLVTQLRHDLRTPMNAVLGYGEVLVAEASELGVAEFLPDLQRFYDESKRMLDRVNEAVPAGSMEPSTDGDSIRNQVRDKLLEPSRALLELAKDLVAKAGHIEAARSDLDRLVSAASKLVSLVDVLGASADARPESAPAANVEQTLGRLHPAAPLATGSDGRLLVVDDNAMNRDLLTRQLVREGYNVMAVASGREALETLRLHDLDLVLLDVVMPEMDGVQVLDQIQRDATLAEVPVIMMSALDEIAGVARCLEKGAADYLTKPVDPVLLRARLRSTLQIRRLREDLQHAERQLEDSAVTMQRLAQSVVPSALAAHFEHGELPPLAYYPEVTAVVVRFEGVDAIASRRMGDAAKLLTQAFESFEQCSRSKGCDLTRLSDRAFTAIAGAPAWSDRHAEAASDLALGLRQAFIDGQSDAQGTMHVRIGVHTGALMTGVAGREKLVFGLWGDAVTTAEAIAAQAHLDAIQLSGATCAKIGDGFVLDNPLVLDVPGRGQLPTRALKARADRPH